MDRVTVADVIAQSCAARGVARVFGVPGGGSSLDLIEAFSRSGIGFHLCRTETAATLMAAADAELRNSFGVAFATQGPGLASAMNGLAHASLDRAPVLLISDGWTQAQSQFDTHQVFDQRGMSAPVVKASSRLESEDPAAELDALIDAMLTPRWGPAYVELTGGNATRTVACGANRRDAVTTAPHDPSQRIVVRGDAEDLIRRARRPVLIVGLEVRDECAREHVRQMVERLHCPVLTTYKAKGVVSDESDWIVGHFTGGAAEAPCVRAADLIVMCGLDPVELIGKPWAYTQRVIDVALVEHPVHYAKPDAGCYGPLAASLASLLPACRRSNWSTEEIAALRSDMLARLACPASGGLSPQVVVQSALDIAGPDRPAITIDAGAHMFSAMAFWRASAPGNALISNGLATMGFALPAGIARALSRPEAPTLVFTGDGGLMMCAGELHTAAQSRARICVIVFNDGALSLIALKQRNRGMAQAGVTWPRVDFASVARGFGLLGYTATTLREYEDALRTALHGHDPCLIDVYVDPSGYGSQARALRG